MNGRQMRAFQDALREAFDLNSLDQMLRSRFEKDRAAIVATADFETVVFGVITLAQREGWLDDLVRAASEYNPGNPALRELLATHVNSQDEGELPGGNRGVQRTHSSEVTLTGTPLDPQNSQFEQHTEHVKEVLDLKPSQRHDAEKHVFVSYSHSDAHLATRAVTALARARVPFFIDRVGLSPGDSLRGRLGDALDEAAAVIALLTENSVRSEWVRRELTLLAERGTRIVPVRCDASPWPTSLGLTLGDALYVDGRNPVDLAGRIPKVFHDQFPQHPAGSAGRFFKLATRPRAPYAQFFPGTIQTALEEVAFGRVCIVVPTDTSVNLTGKVTASLLDFLSIDPARLEPLRTRISSREVCYLGCVDFQDSPVHLLASTVFNSEGRLYSEDQWRAAAAVLGRAQELACATVLVPPMGTGTYGWPRGAALQHWLYGAIRWATSNPLATEEWTWPVICGPGAGGQRMFIEYLDRLDAEVMKRLENRQFELIIEYKGDARPPTLGHHDAMIGSVVGQAWPELRARRDIVAVHPADDPERNRELRYYLGTPLNKTVFADGDRIRIMDRNDLS